MTRFEYDFLRYDRPELKLPTWEFLEVHWPESFALAKSSSPEEIMTLRTAKILSGTLSPPDGICYYDPKDVKGIKLFC